MINRRRAIGFTLAGLPAVSLLRPSQVQAQQAFQRFFPFLIDLDGWQGNKPEGVSMQATGTSMITATREYHRSPARLQAQVLIGPAAQGALAVTTGGMNIETTEGRMNTSSIDGLQVSRTFNFKQKSGAVIVALATDAMFSMSFNGIADDEALTLARKFDWKAIQTAAQQR